jgi:hypothetical protein
LGVGFEPCTSRTTGAAGGFTISHVCRRQMARVAAEEDREARKTLARLQAELQSGRDAEFQMRLQEENIKVR